MITNSKPELTCQKVEHVGEGWLHDAADDTPFDVDGVMYCGRCHRSLSADEIPDKHKRVAERLWEYRFKPGANKLEFERILREEYPE